jgi:heme-degrading monooxygenase HmoA
VLAPRFPLPYVAVIFTNVRTPDDDAGYGAMAVEMERLAASQPGFLGVESTRDPATRTGITVSYWTDAESAAAWRRVGEHVVAQRLGRDQWYESYRVRVATVERDAAFERSGPQ